MSNWFKSNWDASNWWTTNWYAAESSSVSISISDSGSASERGNISATDVVSDSGVGDDSGISIVVIIPPVPVPFRSGSSGGGRYVYEEEEEVKPRHRRTNKGFKRSVKTEFTAPVQKTVVPPPVSQISPVTKNKKKAPKFVVQIGNALASYALKQVAKQAGEWFEATFYD